MRPILLRCMSFLVVSLLNCYQVAGAACAATLSVDHSDAHSGILEGRIELGDFEKLQSFLDNNKDIIQIYLASPGGNLAEAIRMGLLVRRLKLSTVVPSKVLTHQALEKISAQHGLRNPEANYVCASACFFIFIAGVHRSADADGSPIIGIHSPSVSKDDLRRITTDQASAIQDKVRAEIGAYLEIMNVPSRYVLDMYSASRKLRWIREDEFNADFRGFITPLQEKFKKECNKNEVEPLTDCEQRFPSRRIAHSSVR